MCCFNGGDLGISLASRPTQEWLLTVDVVVRDVTRIRVVWEKYPGSLSNQVLIRGFIYRAREQRSVACVKRADASNDRRSLKAGMPCGSLLWQRDTLQERVVE